MLDEVLEWLRVKPDGTYVDATLGAGGHSAAIAQKLISGTTPGGPFRATDQPGPGRTGAGGWPGTAEDLWGEGDAGASAVLARLRRSCTSWDSRVDGVLADLGGFERAA